MILACQVCGEPFSAKRSDAKTCSDACRAKRSRHARDPLIGSPERKQNQLAGLDAKYDWPRRLQARRALRKLGVVPSHWVRGSDGEWSPQFELTPLYRDDMYGYTSHPNNAYVLEEDAWPRDETLLALTLAPRRTYRRRVPASRIESGPLIFNPIYAKAGQEHELDKTFGAPFAQSDAQSRYGVRSYGTKRAGTTFVESELPVGRRSWTFKCRLCASRVSSSSLQTHDCSIANPFGFRIDLVPVTRHPKGVERNLPLAA